MANSEMKNITGTIKKSDYIKLKFISQKMNITLVELMTRILDNQVFSDSIETMFQMVLKLPDKK